MVNGKTKKIIVIKDIDSNIIEEAILILKNDVEVESKITYEKLQMKKKNIDNDYLINEARTIIDNYIKECRTQAGTRRESALEHSAFRRRLTTNTIINLVLLGGIVFLMLMLAKVF